MQVSDALAGNIRKLEDNIERVLMGKAEPIRLCLVAVCWRGHVLIEDVPGVGKTVLAKAWPQHRLQVQPRSAHTGSAARRRAGRFDL